MERTQFTFYRSFADALRRIRKDGDRAKAYDAICDYALNGENPDYSTLSDAAAIAFDLIKPTLDASRRKAENGKNGGAGKQTGSKPEANRKQTGSKSKQTEAKPKQEETPSKKEGEKEKEKEKEKENECYLPLPPLLRPVVERWVEYKREKKQAYKPVGLSSLVKQLCAATEEYGAEAVVDVIELSMASNYQGIVLDRLKERRTSRGSGETAGECPASDWGLDAIVL